MLQSLPGLMTQKETIISKRVRSQSNERASNFPQTLGSVEDEEIPEFFEDRFQVKSNIAVLGTVKSKASDRAMKKVKSSGYIPEEETTQTYIKAEQKTESVNSSKIRKTSTERAITISKNIGFNPQ